jgi:hypothetical protein
VQRVAAEAMAVNLASRRVMETARLRLVRTFRQPWPYPIEGEELGDVEYAASTNSAKPAWLAAQPDAAVFRPARGPTLWDDLQTDVIAADADVGPQLGDAYSYGCA